MSDWSTAHDLRRGQGLGRLVRGWSSSLLVRRSAWYRLDYAQRPRRRGMCRGDRALTGRLPSVERIAGGRYMSMAKETPPTRRPAGLGHWLTGGRTGGSRHRDVQGGTTRAAVLGAGDG